MLFPNFSVRHPPLYVTFSVRSFVCRATYLKNGALCDHNFWYTYVKWWYLHVFFSLLKKYDFLGCLGCHSEKNNYLVVLFKSFESLLHSIKPLVFPPPLQQASHQKRISTMALIQSNMIVFRACGCTNSK